MTTNPKWLDREYVKARMSASPSSIWSCGQCNPPKELFVNKDTGLLECPVHGNDIGGNGKQP